MKVVWCDIYVNGDVVCTSIAKCIVGIGTAGDR